MRKRKYQVMKKSTGIVWSTFMQAWSLQWVVYLMIWWVRLVIWIRSTWILLLRAAPCKTITSTIWSKMADGWAIRERPLIHSRAKETVPVWVTSKARLLRAAQWVVRKMVVLGRKLPWNHVRKPGTCEKEATRFHCIHTHLKWPMVMLEPRARPQTAC